MASFDDFGKTKSEIWNHKGEALTFDHIEAAVLRVKFEGGWVQDKILSPKQYERAKFLAKKFVASTITQDERDELKLLTGV